MSNLTKKDYSMLYSLLGSLSAQYNKLGRDEELELEIRIPNLSRENFNALYAAILKLKHIGKIEQSIIAFAYPPTSKSNGSDSRSFKRMEMYFENGVRVKNADKHIEKHTIEKFNKGNPIEYTVKLAKEKKIANVNPTEITEYRFRLRSSIVISDDQYPEFKNWRFDFTYTRLLKTSNNADLVQKLPELRDEFFRGSRGSRGSSGSHISVENYLQFEPQVATGLIYEVELEWVPDDSAKRTLLQKSSADKIRSMVSEIEQLMPLTLGLIDPSYYERLGYHQVMLEVAERLLPKNEAIDYKSRKTLKNLVNKPMSFTKSQWQTDILPYIDQYYISDKADGERAFIIMGSEFGGNEEDHSCLLLTANRVVRLSDVIAPEDYQKNLTVCDVEIMNLKSVGGMGGMGGVGNIEHGDIYLFDVLMYKGKNVSALGLEEREKYLDTLSKALGDKVSKKILLRLTKSDYKDQIKKVYNRKDRTYKIDGLIFTQATQNYKTMRTWKWKPAQELTIDFLVMRIPTHFVGVKPYIPPPGHTAFWLFNGIYPKDLHHLGIDKIKGWRDIFTPQDFPNLHSTDTRRVIPIQFAVPSDPNAYIYYHPDTSIIPADELHGHVGEFRWDDNFILKNMRPDKDIEVVNGTSYGNAYKVAFETFLVIKNPISIEDLTTSVEGSSVVGGDSDDDTQTEEKYFQTQKQEMYKCAVKFNNFVVAQLLRMCERADWVVDLAAGRGSFLFAYNGFEVQNALFIDKDAAAIETLTKRTAVFGNKKLYLYNTRPKKNMKVYTKIVDLSKSSDDVISAIKDIPLPHTGVNAVISTFAIHYFVGKSSGPGSINNLIDIVDRLLAPGGVFIFTCFDGSRVRSLLEGVPHGKSWDLSQDGIIKYSIKRVPGGENRISVIHPFSNGAYYDEYIVDIAEVISAFEKAGFVVQQNGSFGDWLHKFQQFNAKLFAGMTPDDKLYTSLYQYVTLWKLTK